ncbi:N-acetylneuraminate 9-O-acetyltransferase isoform X2 [Kryptolebias marmoratus]|uniref:N-acetylneuraminate 9-O-acetyltransferase isoform X2 n=1 Tax=Kryptolebias marmoratus TaxID=37003 RepID=UPI000D52F5D9|nr:N-acetylneuraminate 9-O-acetyltransferase isoform X2 [Kryptolebias marmoratus]
MAQLPQSQEFTLRASDGLFTNRANSVAESPARADETATYSVMEEAVSREEERTGGGAAPRLRDRTAACCHGGAKMALLAYSLGKREINHHFTVRNAKLISLAAVALLLVFHAALRFYGGGDSCEWLLSRGRYLGENVWQPYGCMMHKYKSTEAKTCLAEKRVAFVGDSRIRQLFYSFVKIIDPERAEDGNKHEDIFFQDERSSLKVDFLWYPEANNSMKERFILWTHEASAKPDAVIVGAATWSIKLHGGSSETLQQYRANLTAIAVQLESLAERGEVYWVLQDPVNEEMLSENRRMITNQQLELYNEAAMNVLNNSKFPGRTRVKLLAASRQAALETISQSDDGLHLPEGTRNVGAMILMNSVCNKLLRPIDGSCCQTLPPPNFSQKLSACFFLGSAAVFAVLHVLGSSHHRRPVPPDVESLEEKKPATAAAPLGPKAPFQALCRMGVIMAYFYLCDRADVFMKEQKFYTHSTFFIPLIYILVLGVFYSENSKETKLLNREQTDEWKGWMQLVILIYHISGASAFIPVYMHVRVLVAAYLFQTGYGHFSFFWLKGDFGLYRVCQVLFRLNFLVLVLCVVMDRPYQFYYFVPLVTFWFVIIYATMAMWPQILQKRTNSSGMWHLGVLMKLLSLLVFICTFAFSQSFFESTFSVWPTSKLFELNGSIHEWWFRWKLDRFAVFHGMLFAFVYLVLQKRQVLSEGKDLFNLGEQLQNQNGVQRDASLHLCGPDFGLHSHPKHSRLRPLRVQLLLFVVRKDVPGAVHLPVPHLARGRHQGNFGPHPGEPVAQRPGEHLHLRVRGARGLPRHQRPGPGGHPQGQRGPAEEAGGRGGRQSARAAVDQGRAADARDLMAAD